MRPTVLALMTMLLLSSPVLADAPAQAPVPEVSPEEAGASPEQPPTAPDQPSNDDAAPGEAGDDSETAAESEAPTTTPEPPEAPDPAADHEVDEPTEPIAVAPPDTGPAEVDPEPCLAELRELRATFEQAEPLTGEGPCGAEAPVTLTEVGGIALAPPVTLRCPPVRAIALWVDRVVAPLADLYLDSSLKSVVTSTAYQCRKRRGDGTAKWSEHAFANAIDVMGVRLEDGTQIGIAQRSDLSESAQAFQAGIRGGACAFFTTVIGPATNAAHSDHLHMDMAERKGGYRLCE